MEPKARYVKERFAGIIPTYDLLNTLFSLGLDATWRRRAAARLARSLPPGPVLDLCAGTLAQSLADVSSSPGRPVVGVDFLPAMLKYGKERHTGDVRLSNVLAAAGDGLSLPFKDDTFAGCTVSFGLRNLADVEEGLLEIGRVLKPGGRLAVLDFAWPRSRLMSRLYNFYLGKVMPFIGGIVSGDPPAYKYLFSSVRGFERPEELTSLFRECGYSDVSARELTFGIVMIVSGVKGA